MCDQQIRCPRPRIAAAAVVTSLSGRYWLSDADDATPKGVVDVAQVSKT
jgi:hypothetical protein